MFNQRGNGGGCGTPPSRSATAFLPKAGPRAILPSYKYVSCGAIVSTYNCLSITALFELFIPVYLFNLQAHICSDWKPGKTCCIGA